MTALLRNGAVDGLDLDGVLTQYARDGYARLGRLLSDNGLRLLQERTQALMLGEVTHEGMFFQLDATTGRYEDAPLGLGWQGPSLAYRKLEKLEKDPLFHEWISQPLFGQLLGRRIEGPVVLYRAIVFNKAAAHGGSEVPWHQDGGRLWGLTATPEHQLWTALDDAPLEGGCLEVVPGSHLDGLATPLGGVVPPNLVEAARAEERHVALPVQAGEVILLHNLVWHRSRRSVTGQRRMAFSACYMSQSVRCVRKRKAPRVFPVVFR